MKPIIVLLVIANVMLATLTARTVSASEELVPTWANCCKDNTEGSGFCCASCCIWIVNLCNSNGSCE